MKHVSLFCACLLMSAIGHAQTKGSIVLGTNIFTGSVNSFDSKPLYQQNLRPSIGYFATDHLDIGISMATSLNHNTTLPYDVNIFARFYSGKKPHQVIKFFAEAGVGAAHHTIAPVPGEIVSSTNSVFAPTVYITPGINIFLGKVVALELAPEYRYVGGTRPLHRLGADAGIKVFLSEGLFKKMFPHKFTKLN